MSSNPSPKMKIGDFLLRRLEEAAFATCSAFLATAAAPGLWRAEVDRHMQ
jgi:hypothetical protein